MIESDEVEESVACDQRNHCELVEGAYPHRGAQGLLRGIGDLTENARTAAGP